VGIKHAYSSSFSVCTVDDVLLLGGAACPQATAGAASMAAV
jgi:hypothetical protein